MPARAVPRERLADLASAAGLTTAEAGVRRARYGRNDVVQAVPHPWWALAADTARDPMLWFLIVTSTIYALIGDRIEAATLASAILPLGLMDAYLHRRTAASTATLRSHLAARVVAWRDGGEHELAAEELVPGDVVVVPAGTPVPADALLLEGDEVQVDESMLTGESVPVRKHVLPSLSADAADVPIAGDHWLHAGTRVLAGRARLVVAYTGGETLYGEIVRVAAAGGSARTPLQRAIDRLVVGLSAAAALACVLLAAVRLAQGRGWTDAVVSALTLAVAALPEELPVVFTFFLGVGVYRLARRQALVRRAAAVENIGRVTAICSDKTGTLTEGRLQLTHLVPAAGVDEERLVALAAAAARPEGGDPLDVAIAAVARARVDDSGFATGTRIATFPFTEDRKRETAVVRRPDGTHLAATKGSLETLLGLAEIANEAADAWAARADELARGGHKVVACAFAELGPVWDGREPEGGLRVAGLLACEDPVREGVAAALAGCRAAGLRVVMVTGDHPLTAVAVAEEIGLGGTTPVVATGEEIARAVAEPDASLLARVDVVARATPAQKLALVRALQAAGEIVAVTGDGVNDVPALQTADVGIAMGERGTQSAREVAPIVLLDDDFGTIVGAIAEGRQLFHNLQRSIRYLLMIHIPLVASAAVIPLAGHPLLYLPIHIVWLELVMHPTALLAFQAPAVPATIARARRATTLLDLRQWIEIAVVGVALTTLVAGGFVGALAQGADVAHARGIALVTLSFASATLTVVLSRLATAAARAVVVLVVALALVLVQTPLCAVRMHVTPLHGDDLLGAAFAGVVAGGLAALFALAERRGTEDA